MRTDIPCAVDGCGRTDIAGRGFCGMHYTRWKRHGDPGGNERRRPGMPAGVYRGEKAPRWKGGRVVDSQGYVWLAVPEGTPGSTNRKGTWYVAEHRHVMATKLGRPLLPGETVHHINGNRADNRPENLELWVTSQPRGQRPEDLVAWAKEILARYDNGS